MKIDYKQVFERMLKAGNFKNSSEMARLLGMTPQAISNHKKRGELSAGLIIRFAQKCNISVDWLLTGNGETSVQVRQAHAVPAAVVMMTTEAQAAVSAGVNDTSAGIAQVVDEGASVRALLCPDEIIYVGKLLKILRSKERQASVALKTSIDVIIGASVQSSLY